MESLVEDSVVTSQSENGSSTDRSPATSGVRANGTVVFTSSPQVKQVVTPGATSTQSIAVPQPSGSVSIVQLTIPSHVQSVIQPGPNQPSVIQAAGGANLHSLGKNVILLNKGSVIQSTEGDPSVHPVQLIPAKADCDGETVTATITISEDDTKKRREILARRPSYRKILNDLSSTEGQGAVLSISSASDLKDDSSGGTGGSDSNAQDSEIASGNTITVAGTEYHTAAGLLKVVPASAIQLGSQDGGLQGIQTLTMTNAGAGTAGTIVQYAQGQDGQFFVPVTVSAADLQAYQIRTAGGSSSGGLTQGVVMASSSSLQSTQQLAEEASRKRELRLLKNREAAKECRRKKKEYIKCLENRVAVLENQNKALIEELKSLKELYCQKNE